MRTARRFRRYGSKEAHKVDDFAEHRAVLSIKSSTRRCAKARLVECLGRPDSTVLMAPPERSLRRCKVAIPTAAQHCLFIVTRAFVVMMMMRRSSFDDSHEEQRQRAFVSPIYTGSKHEEKEAYACKGCPPRLPSHRHRLRRPPARVYANVGT